MAAWDGEIWAGAMADGCQAPVNGAMKRRDVTPLELSVTRRPSGGRRRNDDRRANDESDERPADWSSEWVRVLVKNIRCLSVSVCG